MRLLGWRRRRNAGNDEFPEGLDAASAWDEQLSAYLDSELDVREAVAVEDALELDPALAVQLDELSVVRDALGSLGELRAPRPFTIEAPPTAVRHTSGRLELVFRMGALAAAVAFAVVLTGDIVGLGDDGVEGWGISRPRFGGGSSEQASDAPQAASIAVLEAAPTSQAAPTPVATVAQAAIASPTLQPTAARAAATSVSTATAAATAAPSAVAAAASPATAEPTEAAAADRAADASPAATTDSRAAARTAVESAESDATPAADQPATPTVAAGESQAAATEAAASADDAADEEDGTGASTPTEQAAATLAPAATATPAPSIRDDVRREEPAGTDDSARALRRAEQWLLLAAVALAVLALGLGFRRRGGRA